MGTLTANRPQAAEPLQTLCVLDKLPPFPSVALKALNMLAGTDSSLSQLCHLVNCDPVFTAEILRLANSPLVSFSKEITSVLQASMLLGFRRLRRLVVTVGLRSYIDKPFSPALRACWRHSVACAIIAEQFARWNSVDRELAYTAGILHDIGRMALAATNPVAFTKLVEQAATDPSWTARQSERELFGIDHCAAGRRLAVNWRLPEILIQTTSLHHDPLMGEESAPEVVRHSCLLAEVLGFAAIHHLSPRNVDEVLLQIPAGVRKHLPAPEELAANITQEIAVIETA